MIRRSGRSIRTFLSLSGRETLIGANGAAWSSAISPALRSSSSARKATAWSTRESDRPRRRSRSGCGGAGRRESARGTGPRAESGAPCGRARPGAAARRAAAASRELLRILRREPSLRPRRERRRAEAEVAVALAGEPLGEPARRLLHPPVLGEPACELLGRLLRLELGQLGLLVGEERARLQLEQRRDQDEELAARLEVELLALGQPIDERDHDRRHVDVGRLELLLQEQRQEQVEGALERVEVQLELAHHHGHPGDASGGVGRGRAGRPSPAAAPRLRLATAARRGGRGRTATRRRTRPRATKRTAETQAFTRRPAISSDGSIRATRDRSGSRCRARRRARRAPAAGR